MACEHNNGITIHQDEDVMLRVAAGQYQPTIDGPPKVTFSCPDCGEPVKLVSIHAETPVMRERLEELRAMNLDLSREREDAQRERAEALRLRDKARQDREIATAQARQYRQKLTISEGEVTRLERAVKGWRDGIMGTGYP